LKKSWGGGVGRRREKMVCQCMWWRERMARELEVVTMALPFSAWSLANPISTSDSAAVDDIDLAVLVVEDRRQGVW